MEYIGMDFHKQYTIATRIRENGNRECCRLANTPASFAAYFAKSRGQQPQWCLNQGETGRCCMNWWNKKLIT